MYTVVYISNDKQSILITKPKTHILCKSTYPNSKITKPDVKYTKANLHLEYVCKDIRRLNFICHGENTEHTIFDTDWKPLEMELYLDEIKNNQHYSVEIKVLVISMRDNLNLKDTINLSE